MNPERKCTAKRLLSLFMAAGIVLTMTPGITVSADTVVSGAAVSASETTGGADEPTDPEEGTEETAEPSDPEEGEEETAEPADPSGTEEASEYTENDDNGIALYSTPVDINDTLYVYGGQLDTDFSFDISGMTLTILTDKTLTITNKRSGAQSNINIVIADGVDATLILDNLTINRTDGPAISMG